MCYNGCGKLQGMVMFRGRTPDEGSQEGVRFLYIMAINKTKNDCAEVAVLIINWNCFQDTLKCLESLYASTYKKSRIIIIDNGSKDESVEEIRASLCAHFLTGNSGRIEQDKIMIDGSDDIRAYSFDSQAYLLAYEVNHGFSSGCNIAIDYLRENGIQFDYLFLLNNDAAMSPGCIAELVRTAENEQGTGIVGAVVKNESDGRVLFAGARFPQELFATSMVAAPNDRADCWNVDRAEGSAMLISRRLLEERRSERGYYFDPDLFLYGEDAELCFYARSKGYQVMMAGNAVVYHRLSQSSGGGGSALSYYYITRNRIRLAAQCLPAWEKIFFHAWFPVSRIARALQKRVQGKPAVAMAILDGLRDGYRGKAGKWGKHIG